MKNNRWKTALLVLGAVLVCGVLLLLGDTVFDRQVGDWFEDNFLLEMSGSNFDEVENKSFYYHTVAFQWTSFKSFLMKTALAVTGLWAASLAVTAAVCRKQKAEEMARQAGQLLRQYFSPNNPNPQPFPKEFAEVAVCAGEVKDLMQRREQQVRQQTAQKNDLIAYLAHDLKTPLTSVMGYLSLLEEAPDMPPAQRAKYVGIARSKAQRLETLINEFFEIARFNLHEEALEREEIDLGYMLAQMADEFYPALMAHDNTIELKAEEDLTVCADPRKLARVFNNLLKNAIAYSDPGTPITVTAGTAGEAVRIAIANRGRDIPAQKLQSIFEKFYRLDEARSTNTGGAGLGLAIAREIVKAHGGRISAASENHTVSFTVELPR